MWIFKFPKLVINKLNSIFHLVLEVIEENNKMTLQMDNLVLQVAEVKQAHLDAIDLIEALDLKVDVLLDLINDGLLDDEKAQELADELKVSTDALMAKIGEKKTVE